MWNPDLYLRYADERGRPFHELVTRIGAENANAILDLGCGPGNLTETLVKRWPAARVHGVDASPEMIAKAVSGTTGVTYEVADLATYEIPDDVDVIVTNATLQWVPGHDRLLRSWVRPGRWIAMQVPANHNAPGHTAMRDLCAAPRWAAKLGAIAETIRMPGSAVHYGRLLRHEGFCRGHLGDQLHPPVARGGSASGAHVDEWHGAGPGARNAHHRGVGRIQR